MDALLARIAGGAPDRQQTVAVFSGCFNPPTVAHIEVARILSRRFDHVLVLPCGPRADRPSTMFTPSVHRAALVDLAFARLCSPASNILLDLSDMEMAVTAPLGAVATRLAAAGAEPWIAVGTDLLERERFGTSEVQRVWEGGQELWADARFVAFERPGFAVDADARPATLRVLPAVRSIPISSEIVRELVYAHKPYGHLVPPVVEHYIASYKMYLGVPPPTTMPFCLPRLRALLHYDAGNAQARKIVERLRHIEDRESPNIVIVAGGDGTMLRAIRELWRLRLPFFGINCGHVGHLLNEMSDRFLDPSFNFCKEVLLHHLPMLYVEFSSSSGSPVTCGYAFNDVWVERASGQTVWLEISVNGEVQMQKVVGDGLLVCTASGSTAYAQAMGCSPVPVGVPVLIMVGNNVAFPISWRPVYLPLDCTIEVRNLDEAKRPLRAFVDCVEMGHVSHMKVRVSNIADARLVFLKKKDMIRKLAHLQFPNY